MKKVILAEGKNDVKFFKEICVNTYFSSSDINTFKAEEVEDSDHKQEESDVVRSFVEVSSPYSILIKSEANKDRVREAFVYFLSSLAREDLLNENTILQIDLDTRDISGLNRFMEKFNDQLSDRGGGGYNADCRIIDEKTDFLTVKVEISLHGEPLGEIILICFKPSLEHIAGIRDGIDKEERIGKIEELASQSPFKKYVGELISP